MASPIERALRSGLSNVFRDEEERAAFLHRLKRLLERDVHQCSVEEFFDSALRIDEGDNDFPYSVKNLQRIVEQYPESKTAEQLLESTIFCVIRHDALGSGNVKTAASAFAEAYR